MPAKAPIKKSPAAKTAPAKAQTDSAVVAEPVQDPPASIPVEAPTPAPEPTPEPAPEVTATHSTPSSQEDPVPEPAPDTPVSPTESEKAPEVIEPPPPEPEAPKEGQEWIAVNKEPSVSTRYKIQNLTTGDKISVCVKAVSKAGSSAPTALENFVQIREIVDRPKISLPRHLRQTFVKHVGEAVNLVIPFQGKPRPQVHWTKNGQPLDPKHASVRNTESDTILFIRTAERKDSGTYELTVQIDSLEDKAKIEIKVAERPGPPKSIKLLDVWGFNAALEWTPPLDDGNSEITGYTIQKADKKTGEWFTVHEHYRQVNCTVSDLIMGNSYYFRVFSENLCGLSEKAAVTKDFASIKKSGISYKPPVYEDRNFAEAPKFTQLLSDRTTTTGYSTKLFCCVRGSPKPKIVWMKNQMEIREDPKFRCLVNQGVCSLEIRKPCPFDGGVYTCKAINSLGEATVDCRLDVKVPQ
ncbi:hypothetical protein GDO86_003326 [Hymenochirus boettgeri]|uniref:Myosin-binding protein H n=1 Tax=Hymenochirus boettgeri TaxID=247094 RepID=A0A8T2K2Y7_9PIPI|nr:hypothetical protein GDO86_003326 [Hymenochirus boettgeri]